MVESARKIKRSGASLTGGIIVGIAVIVLCMLITGELELAMPARWAVSIIIGSVMGAWVRIADL